jgi:uncharacterized Zn finger protein
VRAFAQDHPMKCPKCGETLHIYITENVDERTLEVVVKCPEHGELLYAMEKPIKNPS